MQINLANRLNRHVMLQRRSSNPQQLIGRLAAVMCITMYVSYIPEIIANLAGHPVSPLQPLFAMIDAFLWVSYGWLKEDKDWPVIISNAPGIVFGMLTVVTVWVH